MKKYVLITNEETKECSVGIGTDSELYKSMGMQEADVEQAYNGRWYLIGYAPQKSQEESNAERIAELKKKLADTDYIAAKIAEGSATKEEYECIIQERKAWRSEINELEE